jgi:hypothetical protein
MLRRMMRAAAVGALGLALSVVCASAQLVPANQVNAGPPSGAAGAPRWRALVGADLPLPGASSLGGVFSKSATASQWLRSLGTDGIFTSSQPTAGDISYTSGASGGSAITQQTYNEARVSILEFGAVADSTTGHAAENATAFANALATGKTVYVPYHSDGYNIGTNFITVASGQKVECDPGTFIRGQAAKVFYLTGASTQQPHGVNGCIVDMTGSSAGSTAFRYATSAGIKFGQTIENVVCRNAYECIGDESHASNHVLLVTHKNVLTYNPLGRQIYLRRSRGFVLFRDINCDLRTVSGGLANYGCALFEDFGGLELQRFDVGGLGTGSPSYASGVTAIVFDGTTLGQALWLDRVFVDTVLGDGVLIKDVQYLWANYLESSLVCGTGITIQGGNQANLTNTVVYGSVGQTCSEASKHGVAIIDQTYTNFANLTVGVATGNGIDISGASAHIGITNPISKSNTGTGLAISGTSSNITITGGDVSNGNAAPFSNSASGGTINAFGLIGVGNVLANSVAPSSPPSGYSQFWFDTTDQRLHDINAAGTKGTTVVADTGTANNFLTAVSAAGVISKARPTCANLSDSTSACSTAIGTSGATIPLLNGTNSWSAGQSMSISQAGDTAWSAVNANTAGSASFVVSAGAGSSGFFRSYGSTFAVTSLQNTTAFGPNLSGGVVVFSNANAASGGTGYISLRGGGYDSGAEMLYLDQSGVKFSNTVSFSANGSVATVLGSLGPAGSHTTVQKWLKIIDSTGTTLYIPAF